MESGAGGIETAFAPTRDKREAREPILVQWKVDMWGMREKLRKSEYHSKKWE